MNWASLDLPTQQKVVAKLKQLATDETADEKLSAAYTDAAFELELWLNFPFTGDLFQEWLDTHKADTEPYIGQTVVIDLEKGILKHGPAEEFWNGKHNEEYDSNPNVFITIVADPNASQISMDTPLSEQPAEATEEVAE